MAKQLNAELAIIDKRRPRANEAKVMHIIGEIEGKSCVLMDDMVDTANTLCEAASALKQAGAVQVKACCTHPVLSGQALQRISESELDEVVVTNSIPLSEEARHCSKIRQISISGLLAESIRRIATGDSVSSLFVD
jgi:ribose-phosphate pyrophosphokinase